MSILWDTVRNKTETPVSRNATCLVLGCLALLLWLAGCGSEEKPAPQSGEQPSPTERVLEKGPGEFKADFRTSSLFVTKMEGMSPSNSPHGTTQIWYSTNIESLLDQESFDPLPEGTVSIKTYDMDGQPGIDGVAVMIKKPKGYDPEHNDWYYENRTADGSQVTDMPAPGRNPMCYQCHGGGSTTDYLLGTTRR